MTQPTTAAADDADDLPRADTSPARRPYIAPALEHLGGWSALTLQQSVPVTLLRLLEQAGYFDRYGE